MQPECPETSMPGQPTCALRHAGFRASCFFPAPRIKGTSSYGQTDAEDMPPHAAHAFPENRKQ
ncbi:MAG: hypothetical protein ACI350_04330 [Prevotella sp.]